MNQVQSVIFDKLDAFIKKYYTNLLIKGTIFFVGLGLLYLIFTSLVEYFLWMEPRYRTILFFVFIGVQIYLLFRFICIPLLKLWRLSKALSVQEASVLIGNHFEEVNDKLLNFLQLTSDKNKSELLLASIDQKANALSIVPFGNAINFLANKRFASILLIPLLALGFLFLSGNGDVIGQGFGRVLRYDEKFTPPAPFKFVVLNNSLQVEQGTDFVLSVKTEGKVVPAVVSVQIGSESYILEQKSNNLFQYVFTRPTADVSFLLKGNAVQSQDLTLQVVSVPTISSFTMNLTYPKYLNRKSDVISGIGNAVVPEGTVITWNVNTIATTQVNLVENGIIKSFVANQNAFQYNKLISKSFDYQVVTSNVKRKYFETLNYQISVVKDAFPSIVVSKVADSIKEASNFLVGQIADDYGFSKLQVIYYPKNNVANAKSSNLPTGDGLSNQFLFEFPGMLAVDKGVAYDFYFEVSDNDSFHNYKKTKSAVFSDKVLSENEATDELLQRQNENISGLAKSFKNQDKQMSDLEKLKKTTKEKDNLDFNDQMKVNDFLKRQQRQDEQMKDFAQKMKDDLQKTKTSENLESKKELEKRLENQIANIEKNKKLLDELKDLTSKLKQEELTEKLDKFKQKSDTQAKNLEQLVELTKRFYVEQKVAIAIDKLNKLAEKQDGLADKDADNTKKEQDKIGREFDELQQDLDELKKENLNLKDPFEIPNNEDLEKSIDDNLKKASEDLQKEDSAGKQKAKSKQKKAAKEMKEMAGKMKDEMESEEAEKEEEDAAMLRQILDNLLSFSFSEEQTMSHFKSLKRNSPSYNKNLKQQQDLRLQFQHVDDSLFALGMRNPKISELITVEVGNVHYNINKAVENLVESNISKGVYHQQYTVSSANKLADMLSESLNNMQMSMKSSGKGKGKPKKGKGSGEGMQLPDIIKKQGELAEKAKKGGDKKGDKPGSKPGDGKDGKSLDKGKTGKEGEGGDDGEGSAGEIMKIYQEQKQLRDALQKELNERGLNPEGQNALNAMKDIEKQLLNKGFKNDVLQKMLNLKQELLKLDKAVQIQGEEQKRQSDVARRQFSNNATNVPTAVKDYMNSIEILNRQSLPLQKPFDNKVQEYFKK